MNILTLAGKEIREGLRNRWVLAATLLLALLALTLTFLGSAPTGSVGVQPLDVVIVSDRSTAARFLMGWLKVSMIGIPTPYCCL